MTMILRNFYLILTLTFFLTGCSDRNLSVSVLRSELKAKSCSSGEYLNSTTKACEAAGPGYYAPASSDDRFPCDAGRYCSTTNNTSGGGDGACAGGKFCPAGSTDAQGSGDCAAGFYCPSGSATASGAGACLGGTYSLAGQSSCSACTFSATTFLNAASVAFSTSESGLTADSCTVTEITRCQTGFSVNSSNRLTCRTACSAGTYWTAGSCQPVPKNYYTTTDDENITLCPANSQTAGTGNTSIQACVGNEGYYNCDAGSCYSTTTDGSDNTYSPAGSNTLQMCPAGYACSSGFKVACGTGKYSEGSAASCSSCTNRVANSTAVVFGTSTALTTNSCPVDSITSCQSGFIADQTNKLCRARCAIGSYYDGSACQLTPAGYYTPYGTDTKTSCPWGSTSTLGNYISGNQVQGITACTNIAGYTCRFFQDATTGSPPKCEPTPGGYYSLAATSASSGNLGTPIACAPGYDCPEIACTGTTAATCPAGAVSAQGAGLCQPGKYSTAGSVCAACTNKPLHAVDFVYGWGSAGAPVTTATSCPISHVNSCDAGWAPSGDNKYCMTSNVCLQSTALSAGASCGDGTYYAGEQTRAGKKYRLMIPPANCANSGGYSTCAGGADGAAAVQDFYPTPGSATPMTSQDNGSANTASLVALSSQYNAAQLCSDLKFGSPNYEDWFLPATVQLQLVQNMSPSAQTSVGLTTGGLYYWVSTGIDSTKVYSLDPSTWQSHLTTVSNSSFVRCMREVEMP